MMVQGLPESFFDSIENEDEADEDSLIDSRFGPGTLWHLKMEEQPSMVEEIGEEDEDVSPRFKVH